VKIKVITLFDCTATGVTGHYRHEKLPMQLASGTVIRDHPGWLKARNQQRNWETISQLLQLRNQIELNETPTRNDLGHWEFNFSVENPMTYQLDDQPLKLLIDDCEKVPIVTGLDESQHCNDLIHTSGPEQNIWFQVIE